MAKWLQRRSTLQRVLGTCFLSSFCHSLGGVHSTTQVAEVPSPSSAFSCLPSTPLSAGPGVCVCNPSLHHGEGNSGPQCILGDHEVLMFGCRSLSGYCLGMFRAQLSSFRDCLTFALPSEKGKAGIIWSSPVYTEG